MKTRSCLSFITLICLVLMLSGQAYSQKPVDLSLSDVPAVGDNSQEHVWSVSEIPGMQEAVLEASLKVEVSVSSPTVFTLEARKGRERTVYSSVIVQPGATVAVLDATGLVRAHATGKIDEVFLTRKSIGFPEGVDRPATASTVQSDKVAGVTLASVVAPERRSRVRDILRGDEQDSDIAQSNSPSLPGKFGVKAYPNPFNPVTTIQVALPIASDVDVTVYNVKGQRVKTIHSGAMKPGYNALKWHGRDQRDNPVASGVYFYRVTSGTNVHTGKLMLLK